MNTKFLVLTFFVVISSLCISNEKIKAEEKIILYNTTNSRLPSNYITAILIDGSRVWAGTTRGLVVYDNGRWVSLENAPGGWISSIMRVNDSIWVSVRGNSSGLWRYSSRKWRRYEPPENFSESRLNMLGDWSDIYIAKYDSKGHIWLATGLRLLKFNVKNETWEFAADLMLYEDRPADIEFCNNSVIISTGYSGIFIYDTESGSFIRRLRKVPEYPAILLYPAYDIEIKSDKLYIAHDDRVSVYTFTEDCSITLNGSRWQTIQPAALSPLSEINLSGSFVVGRYIIMKKNKAFYVNFSGIFKEKVHETSVKKQNSTLWIGSWGSGIIRLIYGS